ncbi:MAG: threonine/serine exporter family protein [Planctomycetota bacterium]
MKRPSSPHAEVVLRAAQLLHSYGTPAHRLERVVTHLAGTFGLEIQVFSTPTSIFVSFENDTYDRVRLLRVDPGGVDLGKLVDIDELLDSIEGGRLTPDEGMERMEALDARAPRWSGPWGVLGHALAASTAALFFGGQPLDIGLSLVLGALIGVLEIVFARRHGVAGVFEPLAAFLAAFGSVAAAHLTGGAVNDGVVAIASIIVLLPGLSLTVAMLELATRHLSSGTSRLAGTASVFLTIAFGAYLGRFTGDALLGRAGEGVVAAAPTGWIAAWWTTAAGIVLASFGFALLFRARLAEYPWILAASAFGFTVARVVSEAAAEESRAVISAFAGALTVGLFGNVYARTANRPSTVPLLPGLLVLVPGSIGYRALTAFADHDALMGVESAAQMILVAAALVGGLLVANAVLPPRRIL